MLMDQDFWSLPQIMDLLTTDFQVSYCSVHVRRLLHSWGMYHYKPEPQDYRQAPDAVTKLKERLRAVADGLILWGCSSQEVAFGFADESSPMANSNTARLWSFFHKPRVVNSNKSLRHNTFGFYALQGKSVVREIENSQAETFKACLMDIKQANLNARFIVVVWDNLPAHCYHEIEKLAWSMKIILVNLLPYSPEMNPIEKIWKQIKRKISYKGFIESKENLSQLIITNFEKLAQSTDFAHNWIEEFFVPAFGNCPTPL
jgi:transposase